MNKTIYILRLPEPDGRHYIGSCINFRSMLMKHQSPCNNPNSSHYNSLLYKSIRAVGEWDDVLARKIMEVPDQYLKIVLKNIINFTKADDIRYGLNYKKGNR